MNKQSKLLKTLLRRIKETREQKSIPQEDIEESLIIGPGWIDSFESGDVSITLETLLAILQHVDVPLSDITKDISIENNQAFPRNIYAIENGSGIDVRFKYAKHDAVYFLDKATVAEFNQVIKELRNGLAKLVSESEDQSEALKTEAVAQAFMKAVNFWPDANPSDIWWFIIYRAYCDPYNHPAKYSRLSFEQSWKRTGGWALEEILVRHYGPPLLKKGIRLFIAPTDERIRLLAQANVSDRLEADKADILLTGKIKGKEVFFGVVHVKASFAERRTDDVPMSKALVDGGYVSPLWTLDCKSTPSEKPFNKGELGVAKSSGKDRRSAKRKDIEDDGYFSSCFSYNKNTIPTPSNQQSKAKIFVCDFNDVSKDVFYKFIVERWNHFSAAYSDKDA